MLRLMGAVFFYWMITSTTLNAAHLPKVTMQSFGTSSYRLVQVCNLYAFFCSGKWQLFGIPEQFESVPGT